jgi:molecular chaperone DnaJ
VFHLRSRGLPRVNASGTGDLHVKVQLWTPQDVDGEEQSAIERLGALQGQAPAQREKGFWSKMKEALGA